MQPFTILYAEDEESDVILLEYALKRAGLPHLVKAVPDGQAAVDYLQGDGSYADREVYPFPRLLLLDINMPKKSGLEVLEWIRQEGRFESLPVLLLTSSEHPSDVEKARRLAADDYLLKPTNPLELVEVVRAVHERWLGEAGV